MPAAQAPAGVTPDERLDLDPFYVSVWCRAALSAGVCDRDGDRYRFAPHMATLLLDRGSPADVGGVFIVLEHQEMFGRFEANLASGERLWWDECSPDWTAGVAGTGVGLVRLAEHFPTCRVLGVDGDTHSIEQARTRVAEAGLADRSGLLAAPGAAAGGRAGGPGRQQHLDARVPGHRPGHRQRPGRLGARGAGS